MFQEANVTIQTTNFEQAVKFYQETLAFRIGFRNGNEWAELSMSGLTVGISPTDQKLAGGEELSLGLNVSSLDEAKKSLESRGVNFSSGILERSTARIIFFNDPDGNSLYLCEVKRPFPTF